eukprot:3940523-Rhodomonas_salina.1
MAPSESRRHGPPAVTVTVPAGHCHLVGHRDRDCHCHGTVTRCVSKAWAAPRRAQASHGTRRACQSRCGGRGVREPEQLRQG